METNRPHVAIVENDDAFGAALDRLLRASGCDTILFPSAELFLEQARPAELDCLVLDIHLPGASGFDLLATLKRDSWTLPVLLMTADDSGPVRNRAGNSGCLDFLIKPFDANLLLDAIRRCLPPSHSSGQYNPSVSPDSQSIP